MRIFIKLTIFALIYLRKDAFMDKHAMLELEQVKQEKVIMTDESALPVTLDNEIFVSPHFVISLCHAGSC